MIYLWRIALSFSFIFVLISGFAQSVVIEGTVQSYEGQKIRILKRAQKNVEFKGPLSGATVTLVQSGNVAQTKTDALGKFSISIPEPGNYRLVFSKNDHGIVSYGVRLNETPEKTSFIGFMALLKEKDDENVYIGTYTIKADGKLKFTPAAENPDKGKEDVLYNNLQLSDKVEDINNAIATPDKPADGNKKLEFVSAKEPETIPQVINPNLEETYEIVKDSVLTKKVAEDMELMLVVTGQSEKDIKGYMEELEQEMSGLDPESFEFKLLQIKLTLLDDELKKSESLVASQKEAIEENEKRIGYQNSLIVLILVVAGIVLLLFIFKRQHAKRIARLNNELSQSKTQIVDSIRYAGTIQENYLQSKSGLTELYPNSFITYLPKDIVSGDFYWYGVHDNKKIVVAADCTGHGVPGAMLTVLGHSVINNIVYSLAICDPKEILIKLNTELRKTFHSLDESFLAHGMDACIFVQDVKTNEVKIAGAGNGAYYVSDNKISHLDGSPLSIGYDIPEDMIEVHTVQAKKEDKFFLYSDGYFDQFKGGTDACLKYNLAKFEALLRQMSRKHLDTKESNETLIKEYTAWKGDQEQTDDILLVGIEIA